MKNFLRVHPEAGLIILAIFLLCLIGVYFFWGVGVMVSVFNAALRMPPAPAVSGSFDFEGVKALNLGLQ